MKTDEILREVSSHRNGLMTMVSNIVDNHYEYEVVSPILEAIAFLDHAIDRMHELGWEEEEEDSG